MIIKITDEFWVDIKEILTILPDKNGLIVYYKTGTSGTKIPEDLKSVFLDKLNMIFGEDIKEVWGPTA